MSARQEAGPGLKAVEAAERDLSRAQASFFSPNLQKLSLPSLVLLPQVPPTGVLSPLCPCWVPRSPEHLQAFFLKSFKCLTY